MNKRTTTAISYRFRSRLLQFRGGLLIVGGYALLFLGRGVMRVGQAITRTRPLPSQPSKAKTPQRKGFERAGRYVLGALIAWFVFGGRLVPKQNAGLWLLQVMFGMALFDLVAWLYQRWKSGKAAGNSNG